MQVAELFVSLGIKGQDKTVSALVSVEHGLKGLASMSLEAKAAILGAMYALEQLFSKSGAQGTNLVNLSTVLGVSTKTLQQYDYAARQVGVSNAETEASFKSLQEAMTKTALGKGAPEGLGQVQQLTGNISAQDVQNFMKNPELLLQRLQEYAQKEKRIGVRDHYLKSFGLTDSMIAALSRNAFRPEVLNRAPTYGDGEIKSLDKANIAWSNLGTKIEMAVGHLNAAHGGQIVKDFSILVDLGLKFSDILLNMAERFHVFENLGKGVTTFSKDISGITDEISKLSKNESLKTIFTDLTDLAKSLAAAFEKVGTSVEGISKKSKFFDHLVTVLDSILKGSTALVNFLSENSGMFNVAADGGTGLVNVGKDLLKNKSGKLPGLPSASDALSSLGSFLMQAVSSGGNASHPLPDLGTLARDAGRPQTIAPLAPAGDTNHQNMNVNQTFNFSHDGKNAQDLASVIDKIVNDAFRQLNSQNQGG